MTRKSGPDAAASKPSTRAKSGAAKEPAPKTGKALKVADVAVAKLAPKGVKKTREAAAEPAKLVAKAALKAVAKAPPKAVAPVARAARPVAKPAKPEAKRETRIAVRATAPKGPALAARTAAKALVKASGKGKVKAGAKAAAGNGRARGAAAPAALESARPALVRDSFTMPELEYVVLADVKQACLKAGFEVKKSELLRIGVALVGRLDMATLRQVLDGLPQLKTGRPPSQ